MQMSNIKLFAQLFLETEGQLSCFGKNSEFGPGFYDENADFECIEDWKGILMVFLVIKMDFNRRNSFWMVKNSLKLN